MFFSANTIHFQKTIAIFMIVLFLTTLAYNIVMPIKEAKAAVANTVNQILQQAWQTYQFALDKVYQMADQALQGVQTAVASWFKYEEILERTLKIAWNKLRVQLLRELSNAILKWTRGSDGLSAFVANWAGYLGAKAIQAGDEFLNTVFSTTHCPTFSQQLKNDIKTIYKGSQGGQENYFKRSDCPLPEDELTNFYADGGFTTERWMAMLNGGNFYNNLFNTVDEMATITQTTYETEAWKLGSQEGFRGDEAKGTPGGVQSNAVKEVSLMDWKLLLNSDDPREFFSSVTNAFITRIIDQGLDLMETEAYNYLNPPDYYQRSDNPTPEPEPPNDYQIDVSTLKLDTLNQDGVYGCVGSCADFQRTQGGRIAKNDDAYFEIDPFGYTGLSFNSIQMTINGLLNNECLLFFYSATNKLTGEKLFPSETRIYQNRSLSQKIEEGKGILLTPEGASLDLNNVIFTYHIENDCADKTTNAQVYWSGDVQTSPTP